MEINAYFCIYTHLYVYKFAFKLVLCFSIHLLANYLPMYFLCICICSYIFLSIRLSACWSLIELRSSIYLVSSWFIHSWTSFAFMFANACSFTLLLCFSTCLFTSLTMYLYLWFVDRCQIYSLLHQFLHASICLFIGQCSICLWVSIHGLILLLCILLFACESYLYLHLIVSWCIYHLQFNYLTYVSIFYLHIYIYVYLLILKLFMSVSLSACLFVLKCLFVYLFICSCVCVCLVAYVLFVYLLICLLFAYLLISSPCFLSSCLFAFLFVHVLSYSLIYFCLIHSSNKLFEYGTQR